MGKPVARGGTSVGGTPPWRWIGVGIAAAVVVIVFAVSRSGGDHATNKIEPAAQVNPAARGEPVAPSPAPTPTPAPTLAPAPTPTLAPTPTPAPGEPDIDSLLTDLRNPDWEVSLRATGKLRQMPIQPRAVPILWELVRTGELSMKQKVESILEDWSVPKTFDRSIEMGQSRPKTQPSWMEASLEVVGDELVVRMLYWYGEEVFGSENPPWVEVSAKGGTLTGVVRKKLVPSAGDDTLHEVVASGIGPGTYEVYFLLWGQNRNTRTQHNVGGPSLTVTKP